ncbi:MAG: T9SS type A sorting domain-containing protein [Bacteroidia bacterium]|nr:T9SS type A sorting domain-containing protein [Bacteroidia bacterium]
MKPYIILLLVILSWLSSDGQNKATLDFSGVKPIISINGTTCNIQNQQFSCVPRTCDNVYIVAGDTVEFCTVSSITLNSDTAYWMRWEFNGSSNYPNPIWDSFPTETPLCYQVMWNLAGSYTVDIYYNGWLSAYPWSDCWIQGPSHWIIHVDVSPATGIMDELSDHEPFLWPNPSYGEFHFSTPAFLKNDNYHMLICDASTGKELKSFQISGQRDNHDFNIKDLPNGVYFLKVYSGSSFCLTEKLILLR